MNTLNLNAFIGKSDGLRIYSETWNEVFETIQTKINEMIEFINNIPTSESTPDPTPLPVISEAENEILEGWELRNINGTNYVIHNNKLVYVMKSDGYYYSPYYNIEDSGHWASIEYEENEDYDGEDFFHYLKASQNYIDENSGNSLNSVRNKATELGLNRGDTEQFDGTMSEGVVDHLNSYSIPLTNQN